MIAKQFFRTHPEGTALVLEIRKPVGSLSDTEVMLELDEVLADLEQTRCSNVVVDFCQTTYFGSSMLEALRIVWNTVHKHDGKMVLCNVSPVGREILEIAKFDHIWPIIGDREAALQVLQNPL